MNNYQRIVLVLGAIALVVALLTAPRVVPNQRGHGYIQVAPQSPYWDASVIDTRAVASRGFVVLTATGLLWVSLKGIRKNK